jgi:metallo-beta-lactamase class B
MIRARSNIRKSILLGSVLSLLGWGALAADLPVSGGIVDYPIAGPKSASPQAIAHYKSAQDMVTKDPSLLGIFNSQCNSGKAKADYLKAVNERGHANPPVAVKVFDNLYFIPVAYVSAWAVNTPDGIILIDTLNTEVEMKTVMIPALRKFGLDPAKIKHVIISHEHFDHFGGAKYLQDTYKARIWSSQVGWDAMAKITNGRATPPARDAVITDGMQLSLGGETVTMYLTPGHTEGTVSVLVPVTDHGMRHVASSWGGTSVKDGALATYTASLERYRDMAVKAGADVVLSQHQHVMTRPLAGLADPNGGKSPMVIGPDGFKRYTEVHLECLRWNAARAANGDPA